MARPFHPYDEQRHGKLAVQPRADSDCVEVYYTPSLEQLGQASIDLGEETGATRIKLLEFEKSNGRLTMFPINTLGKHTDFLESKYNKIKMVTRNWLPRRSERQPSKRGARRGRRRRSPAGVHRIAQVPINGVCARRAASRTPPGRRRRSTRA